MPISIIEFDSKILSNIIPICSKNEALSEGYGILTTDGKLLVVEIDIMKCIENGEKEGRDNEDKLINPELVKIKTIELGILETDNLLDLDDHMVCISNSSN